MQHLKNFSVYVNENYYFPTKSERPTQKIIFPVDKYEVGENIQVSIYADNKRAGEVGQITVPTKTTNLESDQVAIRFKDDVVDYLKTTEINRI